MLLLLLVAIILIIFKNLNRDDKNIIKKEIVDYFSNNEYNLELPLPLYSQELHSKKNNFFCYSGVNSHSLRISKGRKVVSLQPCSRKEDYYFSKVKHTLPIFTMLCISDINKYKHFNNIINFLINKCKANLKRIGVVSTEKIDTKYINILKQNNINNILLRDYDTVVNIAESGKDNGSGYSVFEHPNIKLKSVGFYYNQESDIKDIDINEWVDKKKWVEIGETSDDDKIIGSGFGLERLMNIFFDIPYPDIYKHRRKIRKLSKII